MSAETVITERFELQAWIERGEWEHDGEPQPSTTGWHTMNTGNALEDFDIVLMRKDFDSTKWRLVRLKTTVKTEVMWGGTRP